MGLKICLLTDQELDTEPFPDDDWPCDPRPYLPDADWTVLTLEKETCVAEIINAAGEGFDLFFNLCDGAWDEGRVGIEVIQTLEAFNLPFTGADSAYFEPSREAMKRVCRAWGVDTPAYVIAYDGPDVERAAGELAFPLIVKHPKSYASWGITRASRVTNVDELREQATHAIRTFGAALIEEFVEGVEYTVLVAENPDDPGDPIAYAPIRYRFPEGETFKHYDLKWVDFHGMSTGPVEDPELDRLLREASKTFFLGIGGTGYGRCDIRVDAEGRAQMLEINPNCGLYYPRDDPGSADLILQIDPAGHEGFTRGVVEAALARNRRRQKPWRVRPRPFADYGTFASRDIAEGETIVTWEEQSHHLVTRSHVERNWDQHRRDWFVRYAWPLTDEVWVMWSSDPEEWRPINHSCDPNAWLVGLDVVARRPIAAGGEITLEYATFYDEQMPPFPCACGAAECRGVIRGDDYGMDFVAGFEGHLSDHIARKRAARHAEPAVAATSPGMPNE